jgi:hypothetical protein
MQHYYTTDYEGEIVIQSTSWRDAHKDENRIWIPKSIINEPDNLTAHIIGNGPSRTKFDLQLLTGQVGGEQGVRSVGQSYGCNLLYKDFAPTFLLCFDKTICAEIAQTDYTQDNIVYSNARHILACPGHFHLYPHFYNAPVGVLAAHIAAADGHKTVYLLGFDWYKQGTENVYHNTHARYTTTNDVDSVNQKFTDTLVKLLNTYPDTDFVRVCDTNSSLYPDDLNWCRNFRQLEYRQYISEAQLGAIAR